MCIYTYTYIYIYIYMYYSYIYIYTHRYTIYTTYLSISSSRRRRGRDEVARSAAVKLFLVINAFTVTLTACNALIIFAFCCHLLLI